MTLIGLTGPSGSGKTEFCKLCEEFKIESINADLIAHEVIETKEVLLSLCKAFGQDILVNEKLDRKILAKKAFNDEHSTELLNSTVLPHIVEKIKEIISQKNCEFLILDAPTLFESGLDSTCDIIISVISNRDIRLKRIISRDGISEEAANDRLNAGKSDEFYISRSNYIIFNNGTEEDFKNESRSVIMSIVN